MARFTRSSGGSIQAISDMDAPMSQQVRRLGFLIGQIKVPDDFDGMGAAHIEQLFGDAA